MVRNYVPFKSSNNKRLTSYFTPVSTGASTTSTSTTETDDSTQETQNSSSNEDTASARTPIAAPSGIAEEIGSTSSVEHLQSQTVVLLSSDEENEHNTPPRPKRVKESGKSGAATYKSRFKSCWTKEFEYVGPARDDYHFRCLACNKDVPCSHMGRSDVIRHMKSNSHEASVKAEKDCKQYRLDATNDTPMLVAELRATNLLVTNNTPIAFSDSLAEFVRLSFNKDYKCARTKTTALIGALADHCRSKLVEKMKCGPYSISTDGSNDNGLKKMYPMVISVPGDNGLMTRFLDMCTGTSGSAEAMYQGIKSVLERYDIPLSNCIALGVDNTNSNIGQHNSLATRITADNPSIYVSRCICHILHNSAKKGGEVLGEELDIEDFVLDIYNHFVNSQPRKMQLLSFCEFVETDYKVVLKHVATRWLSLERVVDRVLELYEPLRSYFISSELSDARVKRLRKLFSDPLTEVMLQFLKSFLPTLTGPNKQLQQADPQIHRMHDIMLSVLSRIISRYAADPDPDLTDLENFNFLSDQHLGIGVTARFKLCQLISSGDVSDARAGRFLDCTRRYMIRITQYLCDNLPLRCDVLQNLKWLQPTEFKQADIDEILCIACRYRKVHKWSDEELDNMREQLIMLSRDPYFEKILNDIGETVEPFNFWKAVGAIEKGGGKCYGLVYDLAKLLLVIPHSNASSERVFSMVNKNLTSTRSRLDKDATLNNIMVVKTEGLPLGFTPDEQLLKSARKATRVLVTNKH